MVMALAKQPKTRSRERALYRNHALGQAVPSSKLSVWQVVEARELHALGVSQRQLAMRYGVSQPTVCAAVNRQTWFWVGATDQEVIDLGEHDECEDEIRTTGRIVSPFGIHATVRAAELSSGLDRIVIATLLRTPDSGWMYEVGEYVEAAPDLWASSPWPCDGRPWPT